MTVVIFADWDDPDVRALHLAPGTTWVKLSQSIDKYLLWLNSAGEWHFESNGVHISSAEVAEADRVVFRRWRGSPPSPIVISNSGDSEADSFIERQWEAALLGALEKSYSKRPHAWSRSPVSPDLKVLTLTTLNSVVRVPSFIVSRSIVQPQRRLVYKSLHADQSVGEGRVPTVAITQSEARQVQPCPAIYQERIEAAEEWRIGYTFGSVGIGARTFVGSQVDRRFEAPIHQRSVTCPETEKEAMKVSAALGLNMFTADVLVTEAGIRYWCDVNVDGLYAAADTASGNLIRALMSGLRL